MHEGWEEGANVRRTVSLPRELCDRLADEAARQGRSVDDLIAELVRRGLEQEARGTEE
jgi:metal-responsive CopG/Arc/MetJ family transcriptional regulator